MLRHLRIQNLALIDDIELSFEAGLNIITGETGAGKSLLMQGLALAVGGRATADLVRHDREEALVEAVFDTRGTSVGLALEAAGHSRLAEQDELLVRRIIGQTGRSRVYLNNSLATVALLRQLGASLLHIYGQHEQHILREAEATLQLLDAFAGLTDQTAAVAKRYLAVRHACSRLETLTEHQNASQARRELAEFQLDEIRRAQPIPGEDESLRQEKLVLVNAEKLYHAAREAEEGLTGGERAMTDQVARLLVRLQDLTRIDEQLQESAGMIADGLAQLEEAALVLRRYSDRLRPDPERLEEIEARLAVVSQLKRKYGGTVEAVVAHQAKLEEEREQVVGADETIAQVRREVESESDEAWQVARRLSGQRRRAAQELETLIVHELASLGMSGAGFEVRFEESPAAPDCRAGADPLWRDGQQLCETGCDTAEFYLCANPGEPSLPLTRVASGGELSRLMLALNAAGAAAGGASTLIFDEVDAGIGGAVAEVVGRRLRTLAFQRQVVCITHLPQIAAYADHPYRVIKETRIGRTVSTAKRLNAREQIQELARMVGGVEISAEAKRHAREMLARARNA